MARTVLDGNGEAQVAPGDDDKQERAAELHFEAMDQLGAAVAWPVVVLFQMYVMYGMYVLYVHVYVYVHVQRLRGSEPMQDRTLIISQRRLAYIRELSYIAGRNKTGY